MKDRELNFAISIVPDLHHFNMTQSGHFVGLSDSGNDVPSPFVGKVRPWHPVCGPI